MAGQICRTCEYVNDWCYCSPNSVCDEYVRRKPTKDDIMIEAAVAADLSKSQLSDVYDRLGIMGVYNLGMRHMYDYLETKGRC